MRSIDINEKISWIDHPGSVQTIVIKPRAIGALNCATSLRVRRDSKALRAQGIATMLARRVL